MARYDWTDGDSANASRLDGLPGGVMGYANFGTSNQTGISTSTDVTGLTVTFTAEATRLYKTTVNLCAQQRTSGGRIDLAISSSSAGLTQRSATLATDDFVDLTVEYLETGVSGSITRKAQIATSAGTVDVQGTNARNGGIVVEDLGVA